MGSDAWLTPETLPGGFACRVLRIPDDTGFIAAVEGALLLLADAANWEKFGDVDEQDAADAAEAMYLKFTKEPCMHPGFIVASARSDALPGWLLCDGSLYDVVDYQELYDVVGNTYGGVEDETFWRS